MHESRLELENLLIESLIPKESLEQTPALFILASPRTGSTITFQLLCSVFRLSYISNLVNSYFPETPVTGMSVHLSHANDIKLEYSSHYGKVNGLFQPSEASYVMKHWFGGGHPSQVVSANIIEGMEKSFIHSIAAINVLCNAPLVIKNAWNCFRIKSIASLLPRAQFLWVKRDIVSAAKSDLAARYKTGGAPDAWNSATPANVDELKTKPYWQQVVENQYEFNLEIGQSLAKHAPGRFSAIWYEDLCHDPESVLNVLAEQLPVLDWSTQSDGWKGFLTYRDKSDSGLPGDDETRIGDYVGDNAARLAGMVKGG